MLAPLFALELERWFGNLQPRGQQISGTAAIKLIRSPLTARLRIKTGVLVESMIRKLRVISAAEK